MSASMLGASPRASRRTLVKGAAWTVPALTIAAAAPVLAASREAGKPEAGLFVQIIGDPNGVGIAKSGTANPQYPDTDLNWDDATRVSTGRLTSNGEGVFTPGGTVGSGTDTAGTGFWISLPLDENGDVIAGSSITIPKGASFALDYQIQLKAVATDARMNLPGADSNTQGLASTDGGPIMQNWTAVKGNTTTDTTSAADRFQASRVRAAYERETYWWKNGGYDGAQGAQVLNFSLRYTTNEAITFSATTKKKYVQLLLTAPSYRAYWPWINYMAVRIRPLSGTVTSKANGAITTMSLLDVPGISATTTIMGYPGMAVPANFPNWNISTDGDGNTDGGWVS